LVCKIADLHYNANMQVREVEIEETFQALSDTTRLRVVRLLIVSQQEVCLCELVDSLLEPDYKLSRHLKLLRNTGILESEKEGRWVYHRLVSAPNHLIALFDVIRRLPDPNGVHRDDLERFEARLRHREDDRCRVDVLPTALKTEAV
jgi:ArsR family transcriptional regulator, arsenate/arsenite/antimonite-responsive transcriptional repressor